MSHEHDDALADLLYEAALDEDLWDHAIQDYAEVFGGVGIVILRPGLASPIISVSEAVREGAQAYNEGWWREDIIVSTAIRLNLNRPGVLFDDDFLPAEVKARNIYFQEFLRQRGVGSVATVVTRPNGGETIAINVQRKSGLTPPDAEERRRFTRMSRTLSRALAIRLRLEQAEGGRRRLVRQFADFDCAAAIADDQGRVVEANEAFEALAGLVVHKGRLLLQPSALQQRFDAALHAAIVGSLETTGPDTLVVPRPGNAFPLLMRVTPLAEPSAERFSVASLRRGALALPWQNVSSRDFPGI